MSWRIVSPAGEILRKGYTDRRDAEEDLRTFRTHLLSHYRWAEIEEVDD